MTSAGLVARLRAGQTEAAPLAGGRWVKPIAFGLTGGFLLLAVLQMAFVLSVALTHEHTIGLDYSTHLYIARDWLGGNGYYLPRQLDGPYLNEQGDSLYPPTMLYLFVPFTVLPAVLWWATPLTIIGYILWRLRPAWWTWPLIALALAWPKTVILLLYGNVVLWGVAMIAAGMLWHWPLAFTPLKPILAPFALLGVRHRSFWIAMTVLIVASIPFGAMWLDYIEVLLNTRTGSPFYLFGDLPAALIPVVAWLGRTTPRRRP